MTHDILFIIYWHLQNKHQVQMIWHDYDCGPTLHLLLTRLCVGGAASDQFYVLLSWVIKYSNILNIHPCVTWPECPPDLHHGGRYRPGSVSPQVTLGQYCGNLGHTMHPPPTPTPPSWQWPLHCRKKNLIHMPRGPSRTSIICCWIYFIFGIYL